MSDEVPTPGPVGVRNPLEPGTRAIFHRGYHLELDDGWFGQGEFLLRSDGILFTRSVVRGYGAGLDGPGAFWFRDDAWAGGVDSRALVARLTARGYEMVPDVYPIGEYRSA